MKLEQTLRVRLAELEPVHLELEDESARHAGHAGAGEGSHWRLVIVSQRFLGLDLLARHRLVYGLLDDLLRSTVHALRIDARTPDEYFQSPPKGMP